MTILSKIDLVRRIMIGEMLINPGGMHIRLLQVFLENIIQVG